MSLALAKSTQVVELLLEGGDTPDATRLVKLLEEGADPNVRVRENDVSAMHIAAGLDNAASYVCLETLLKYGGNPNVRSSEGLTPLHIAALWGRREAVNLLLENGGDAAIPDADGKTPLDMARETTRDPCVLKLLEAAIKRLLKSRSNNSSNVLLDESQSALSKYQSQKHEVKEFLDARKKRNVEADGETDTSNEAKENLGALPKPCAKVIGRENDFDAPIVDPPSTPTNQSAAATLNDSLDSLDWDPMKCGIMREGYDPRIRLRKDPSWVSWRDYIRSVSPFKDLSDSDDERTFVSRRSTVDKEETSSRKAGEENRGGVPEANSTKTFSAVAAESSGTGSMSKEREEPTVSSGIAKKSVRMGISTLKKVTVSPPCIVVLGPTPEKEQDMVVKDSPSSTNVTETVDEKDDETVRTESMIEFEELEKQLEDCADQTTLLMKETKELAKAKRSISPLTRNMGTSKLLEGKQPVSVAPASPQPSTGFKGSKKRLAGFDDDYDNPVDSARKKMRQEDDGRRNSDENNPEVIRCGAKDPVAASWLESTGIMDMERPTLLENSLTIVTARDETSVCRRSDPSQGNALPSSGRSKVKPAGVIMDKFLESFKVSQTIASVQPPFLPSKSFADGVHVDPGCDLDDTFISVTPLDASSASRASSYATCINCEKTVQEYVYSDEKENVQLIERVYSAECAECCESCPPAPPFIPTPEVSLVSLESSEAGDTESVISLNFDWRTCRQRRRWRKSEPADDKGEENLNISESLTRLDDNEIRRLLLEAGEKAVPPISDFTRSVFLRKLTRLRKEPMADAGARKPVYPYELAQALQGVFPFSTTESDFDLMVEDFSTSDADTVYSVSASKCKACFNYLLLDPRVTRNLPARIRASSSEDKKLVAFRTFVAAVFYVGKGTGLRPFSHFYDAINDKRSTMNEENKKKPSEKINQIRDVWESGHGVVSHHCFQSCIPAEAFTREALMIEALGLDNLSNKVRGKAYGYVANWEPKRRRSLGVFLLDKAFKLFLVEGEHQLRRFDVK